MNRIRNSEELFIVQSMIDGNRGAFKYFFDTYYTDLCNFVYIYVRDKFIAEEIVQNIFIYLWENKDKLEFKKSVKSYLFTAGKNRSLNHIRSARLTTSVEVLEEKIIDTKETDQYIELEELRNCIQHAIDSLPTKCKEIYQLSREQKMTNSEIASELGISIKTVENQMTIALRKIRTQIKPYNDKIFFAFISLWLS